MKKRRARIARCLCLVMVSGVTGMGHANTQSTGNTPVISYGFQVTPYIAPETQFGKIAAGRFHNLALATDGTLVAWGLNDYCQCSALAGSSNILAIAAGQYHSLALRNDGTLVAGGDNTEGQCAVPAGLTNVVQVSAGWFHSMALKADGTVVA